MEFADEILRLLGLIVELGRRAARGFVDGETPKSLKETGNTRDALGAPRLGSFERPEEHQVHAERVGAVVLDDGVGVDDVAAALGHLLAVFAHDKALVEELRERLRRREDANVVQEAMPEARIQQVEHGVLGAADIEVGAAPILERFGRGDVLGVLRVEVAEVIPARTRPLGHGVRFAGGLDPERAWLGLRLRDGGATGNVVPDLSPLGLF